MRKKPVFSLLLPYSYHLTVLLTGRLRMSQSTLYLLIFINLVIIAGLMMYLYQFFKKQRVRKEQAAQQLQVLAEKVKEQREYLIDSLRVIAQSLVNAEIPLTEGCIRCKVLLDNLDPQLGQSEQFIVFNEVYEKSKHIPKLEAWKKLKTREKLKYIAEMDELEARHRQAILLAATALRGYRFDRYH